MKAEIEPPRIRPSGHDRAAVRRSDGAVPPRVDRHHGSQRRGQNDVAESRRGLTAAPERLRAPAGTGTVCGAADRRSAPKWWRKPAGGETARGRQAATAPGEGRIPYRGRDDSWRPNRSKVEKRDPGEPASIRTDAGGSCYRPIALLRLQRRRPSATVGPHLLQLDSNNPCSRSGRLGQHASGARTTTPPPPANAPQPLGGKFGSAFTSRSCFRWRSACAEMKSSHW